MFYQKSPIFYYVVSLHTWVCAEKKSLIVCCVRIRRDLYFIKRALYTIKIKRALCSIKRALCSIKRALYSIKWVLYSIKRALYSIKRAWDLSCGVIAYMILCGQAPFDCVLCTKIAPFCIGDIVCWDPLSLTRTRDPLSLARTHITLSHTHTLLSLPHRIQDFVRTGTFWLCVVYKNSTLLYRRHRMLGSPFSHVNMGSPFSHTNMGSPFFHANTHHSPSHTHLTLSPSSHSWFCADRHLLMVYCVCEREREWGVCVRKSVMYVRGRVMCMCVCVERAREWCMCVCACEESGVCVCVCVCVCVRRVVCVWERERRVMYVCVCVCVREECVWETEWCIFVWERDVCLSVRSNVYTWWLRIMTMYDYKYRYIHIVIYSYGVNMYTHIYVCDYMIWL